ncbi:DUF3082 domain-containing protein [Laspinema palackyanum]|uniref:DUF3082 domain-containing protein n=1 Tax=Laspinema palackyanum TaxID=3231601 RepID=UPI00345D2B7F|nr:DUF3082 domain-containing protein [Laspinema sp. D2c]
MTNPTPTQPKPLSVTHEETVQPTLMRCFMGSLISGGFAYACMMLTHAIASTFANKPIHSDNPIAVNISAAVRTLVTGVSTLATFIFAFAALGLFCLGLQLLFQKFTQKS